MRAERPGREKRQGTANHSVTQETCTPTCERTLQLTTSTFRRSGQAREFFVSVVSTFFLQKHPKVYTLPLSEPPGPDEGRDTTRGLHSPPGVPCGRCSAPRARRRTRRTRCARCSRGTLSPTGAAPPAAGWSPPQGRRRSLPRPPKTGPRVMHRVIVHRASVAFT